MSTRSRLQRNLRHFRSLATGRHRTASFFRPSIGGGVVWLTECNDCDLMWYGVEPTRDRAEGAARGPVGDRDVWHINDNDGLKTKRRFRELPAIQRVVPRHGSMRGTNPYVLATDGAYHPKTLRCGWAYMTGAGWHQSGMYVDQRVEGAVQRAELTAIIKGLQLFPFNAHVTVLFDAKAVGTYVQNVFDRHQHTPKWIVPQLHNDLVQARDVGRSVSTRWVPRETNQLQWYADKLAFAAARPFNFEVAA